MANVPNEHSLSTLLDGLKDIDVEETQEWAESLEDLIKTHGTERAEYILRALLKEAGEKGVKVPTLVKTDYINTIPVDQQPEYPGDEELERQYRAWIRWNAAIMVQRAQKKGIGVGGHISTFAGVADLYEMGQNHFFRGRNHPGGGDQVFFQGHSSPGVYSRAFVEGVLTEEQMDGFRQEKTKGANGIPSYPHPRCMPEFWQFPTVSMGLGSQWAVETLYSGLAQGIGAEIVFALLAYRRFNVWVVAAAGALSFACEWALELFLYGHLEKGVLYNAIYLACGALSGIVLAGVLAWALTNALAKTGALDRFASGRGARELV